MDADRRTHLLSMKLAALVGEAAAGSVAGDFGGGAAMVVDGTAWVLLEQQPERGLGPALAWALRREAASLVLLTDSATGLLARRAQGFTFPIDVRRVTGREHVPASAEPLPVTPIVPAEHLRWEATIREGGAVPVVEHGVLVGEVAGLEVCRVVTDPHSGAVRLDVGIGADDREMFQMLHGDKPTVEALADVVAFVAAQRVPGAPRHPLNLLAQARLVRSHLVANPGLVGAASGSVVVAEPPVPRPNLKDPVPCVAVAEVDGRQIALVCSVGVDLDLVPYAIDACTALGLSEARLVVPSRDALPVQHRLAALARSALTVVALDAVA